MVIGRSRAESPTLSVTKQASHHLLYPNRIIQRALLSADVHRKITPTPHFHLESLKDAICSTARLRSIEGGEST